MALVYVNGSLVAQSDATVSVFDHGLVVGDGVFETILLRNGEPFALSRHLDRLQRSATGLRIGPVGRESVIVAIEKVVATADFTQGRIRVTLTAGHGPLGSSRIEGPPTLVVACEAEAEEAHLSTVALVPWTRNERGALVGLKTTSYAENALALAFAASKGADEAIFANNNAMLCEGTGSNIFVVRDGQLLTPPLSSGCLAGVTRALVLERIGGIEVDLAAEDLFADEVAEVFLTSTIRGVQGVARVDARGFPDAPGPITEKVAVEYLALLDEVDP